MLESRSRDAIPTVVARKDESNKSPPFSNGSFIETVLPTNNNQCYFQFQHGNAILGTVTAVQVFKYTRNKAQHIKMLFDFARKLFFSTSSSPVYRVTSISARVQCKLFNSL